MLPNTARRKIVIYGSSVLALLVGVGVFAGLAEANNLHQAPEGALIAKASSHLPKKPIKAVEDDFAVITMSYGGFRQQWNSPDVLSTFGSDGPSIAQNSIDAYTKKCQEIEKDGSIGAQTPRFRVGSRVLRVTSSIYTASMYSPVSADLADWLGDCTDLVTSTYTLQAEYRRNGKTKLVGKPTVFGSYGTPQFNGYVEQHVNKVAKLIFPKKLSSDDLNHRRAGWITKVDSAPSPPFQGQTIFATVPPESDSWTNWLGRSKKHHK